MFGHLAEHIGRFSNEELEPNQTLELHAERWNLQLHHGSARDPECWSRLWLEHDLECSCRLSSRRRNLQESWYWAGQTDISLSGNHGSKKVCDEETSDCSKSNVMRTMLTHCRSTSRGKEVLDRHVAASSLKRLVGWLRGRSCNWNLQCETCCTICDGLDRAPRCLFTDARRALPTLLQLS